MAADPRAHAAVKTAITEGALPAPTGLACADCAGRAYAYHHHRGYDPQHWLDVVALCGSCHARRHLAGGYPRLPKDDNGTSVVFSVRMPRELHERLAEFSRTDYSTVNRSIVVAVERYLRQMTARRPKEAPDAR